MNRALAFSLLSMPGLLAACTPDRCALGNDELSMVVTATDLLTEDGEEVRVAVNIAYGERTQLPTWWTTCDGDRVLINGEEAREIDQDDRTDYTLFLDGDAGEVVTVELDRADEDLVTASVERPPRFEILTPEPGASLSRSEQTQITWAPPADGEQMQIQVLEELGGGRCILSEDPDHDYKSIGGVRVDDVGQWTIPPGVLANDGDLRCDARYLLRRFSRGDYPEALAPGGFVQAEVLRILVFESVP